MANSVVITLIICATIVAVMAMAIKCKEKENE